MIIRCRKKKYIYTNEFDDTVKELIREIGKEFGVDEDWLNTDCATLDGFLTELEPDIHWERTEYQYKNIVSYIEILLRYRGILE